MDIVDEEILDKVLEDPTIGAGNFVYRLHAAMPPGERPPALYVDRPVPGLDGEPLSAIGIADVVTLADRLAAAYAQLGVVAKEPVALYLEDSAEYFLHFVALTSLGAFPVSINGDLDPAIAAPFTCATRARHLIAEPKRLAALRPLLDGVEGAPRLVALAELEGLGGGHRPPLYRHHAEDAVLLAHTSGTTGIPKAVIFTHESMFHGVRQQIRKQRGRRLLSMLPHSHGASLSVLMLSLPRGATVRIQSKKAPEAVLKEIERFRPDAVAAFPKVFVDLCRQDLQAYDLDSVQNWIATGDANHEPHIRRLIACGHHWRDGERRPGSHFVDNLGSSEFAFAMFRNVHGPGTERYERCIGKPFPWVDAAVLDEWGELLPPGQVGKLGVFSTSVTKGYWNNHNLTEQNRLSGYWLTGDLVYRGEDGLFYHVDRTTDWIDTASGPLYSCQCEEWLLKRLPALFEVSVVGRKGPDGEWHPVALVELAEPAEEVDSAALLQSMNALMRQRGWPAFLGIEVQSAHEYVGVSGKKLKRQLVQASRPPKNQPVKQRTL